ncbi:Serine/threonine-protein phosphatase [Entamoeba marina]
MSKVKLPPRPSSVAIESPSTSISQIRSMLKQGKQDIAPHIPFLDDRLEEVQFPEDRLLPMNMLFSGKGHTPNLKYLRQHLIHQGRLTQEAALALIRQARDLFKNEPNLLTVYAPVVIIGDVHGQFYDLLNVMDIPSINTLNDIMQINRFTEPGNSGPLTDILWSDPINDWDEDDPDWDDHPFQLPDFQDGMSYSLPYLLEHCVKILQELVIAIKDDKEMSIEDIANDAKLKQKTEILLNKSAQIREQHEEYRKVLSPDYHKNMSKFEKALRGDKQNEQYPTPEMVASRQKNHIGLLKRGASSPALLQRIQRDQSFLSDRSSIKKTTASQITPIEIQEINSTTQTKPNMKRQQTKTFQPRNKK